MTGQMYVDASPRELTIGANALKIVAKGYKILGIKSPVTVNSKRF